MGYIKQVLSQRATVGDLLYFFVATTVINTLCIVLAVQLMRG